MNQRFPLVQIGLIRTPYKTSAPYQPIDNDAGDFRLVLDEKYAGGLTDLDTFRYIYVIYYVDRLTRGAVMMESPAWVADRKVGLFASRSPARPSPLGISVVRLKRIVGNEVHTSGLDVFDLTPLLDIKPYIKDLDSKQDANYGWIDDLPGNKQHLLLHIMGIPHDY
ncbi:MAG: tRNA (N6-threonylcarbamoyladenosine(37)-N6)-methyltransferase TrmO [Verrucomicrobia bacterium]|nr:tRNA (N6-threonylcarbamoyladenosine(37)-N6)-methyltransferase TrmO [Verrucomicrobiota bacterium]